MMLRTDNNIFNEADNQLYLLREVFRNAARTISNRKLKELAVPAGILKAASGIQPHLPFRLHVTCKDADYLMFD